MRYAIISDIHSNLTAFQAVLRDIESRGEIDLIWCMGDIVGYGPEPGECIDLLRQYDHICVAGNHDLGAIGKMEIGDFNSYAAIACRWTENHLIPEHIDYLANLPLTTCEEEFTMAHGSPRGPIWEYLLSAYSAYISFSYFETVFCLVGHSHVPVAFEYIEEDDHCTFTEPLPDSSFSLEKNRMIINPGSVGQPRDGDPRASYILYDSDDRIIRYHRVPYDIADTQRKMEEYGLPPRLAARLDHGW